MTLEEVVSTIEIAIAEVEWNYPLNYAIAFEEAISALKEKQEQRRNNMEWISVKDRLPKPGTRVLLTGNNFVGEGYIDDNGEWERYYCGKVSETLGVYVAHWMPLPEPPKEVNYKTYEGNHE